MGKALVVHPLIKIHTAHAPNPEAEVVHVVQTAQTVEKIATLNHAKELVVLMAAGLVVAIINEELMVPCVLCGPDAHAPSHQLVLEHLNFLEIT